jgi:hypothetical protein
MRMRDVLIPLVLCLPACGGSDSPSGATPTSTPTPAPTPTPTPTATPVPAANVSGDWRSEARAWYFRLEQSGTSITGYVIGFRNVQYPPTEPAVQITGSVDASRNVIFRADVYAIEFSGRLEADGRRMTGQLFDCGNGCRNYGEILIKQ